MITAAIAAILTVIPIVTDKLQIEFPHNAVGGWWFAYSLAIRVPGIALGQMLGLKHGETPLAWIALIIVVNLALGFLVGTFLRLFNRQARETG